MNKEEKAAAIDAVAQQVKEADAVLAVDYRGISVAQAAELRAKLREADTTFRIVKNSLTLRALEQAGADELKPWVDGPTAFAFVRGDVATAAKALNDFARVAKVLELRGGLMDGESLDAETVMTLARLPARPQLEAQAAGMIAAPLTGLVRGLGSMLSGLAVALGQVSEQRAGEEPPPQPQEPEPEPEAEPEAAPEPEPELTPEPEAEATEDSDDPTEASDDSAEQKED